MEDHLLIELLKLRSQLDRAIEALTTTVSPAAETTTMDVQQVLQQAAAQHPNPAPARALYHSIKKQLPHLSERTAAQLLRAAGYTHQRKTRCNVYWRPGT